MQNDVSGSKKEKSELPEIIFEEENFISVAKRKAKFFLTNITLEPVMLFYGVSSWVRKNASKISQSLQTQYSRSSDP